MKTETDKPFMIPCTPENFAERFTGDMIRDYEMLTPDEWLEIYGNDEPDFSGLERGVEE